MEKQGSEAPSQAPECEWCDDGWPIMCAECINKLKTGSEDRSPAPSTHGKYSLSETGATMGHWVCECGSDLGDCPIDEIDEVFAEHKRPPAPAPTVTPATFEDEARRAGMEPGQYRMWRDAGGPAPPDATVLRYCGKCNMRRYFREGKCEMCAQHETNKPTTDERLTELIGIFEEGTTGGAMPLSTDDIGDVYAWLQWVQAADISRGTQQ